MIFCTAETPKLRAQLVHRQGDPHTGALLQLEKLQELWALLKNYGYILELQYNQLDQQDTVRTTGFS